MNNMLIRYTAVWYIPYSTSHYVEWLMCVRITSYTNNRVVILFAYQNLAIATVVESTTLLLEAL